MNRKRITWFIALPIVVLFTSVQADGPNFTSDITITNDTPDIELLDIDAYDAAWEICIDAGCASRTGILNPGPNESFNIAYSDVFFLIPVSGRSFVIESGAGDNLLYLDADERIGINTNVPAKTLDIRSTLPGIRLDNISSGEGQAFFQMSDNRFTIEGDTEQDILNINTDAPASSLNITSDGVGIGTTQPARSLHLSGNNAVFRMDRSLDTAAFIMVRTTNSGLPLKTYVVGTNASGVNNGEFIINDLGTAVVGGGARRMTITNSGEVHFTGTVRAPGFVTTSSRRFKENVTKLSNATALVEQLQGVRFSWKDTGKPALGLIAEEVATVLPELVARKEGGNQIEGVDYPALTAVLIEAVKEQGAEGAAHKAELDRQQAELASLKIQVDEFVSAQEKIPSLAAQMAKIDTVSVRLSALEKIVVADRFQALLVHTGMNEQ